MIKSFVRLRSVNPGFNPENAFVLTVNLPPDEERSTQQLAVYHNRVLERLSSIPGVSAAGAIDWLPFDDALIRGDFYSEAGSRPRVRFNVTKPGVTPGYFEAIGIRLLRGRTFTGRDTANCPAWLSYPNPSPAAPGAMESNRETGYARRSSETARLAYRGRGCG